MAHSQHKQTDVLYNADCPVCSLEINHYARLSETNALPLSFSDLNNAEKLADWGLDVDTAAKRLHVQQDGLIYNGIPAFLILWRELPGYRNLAKVVSLPGVYRVSVWTYDYVLAPVLFKWHKRRVRRRT